MFTYFFWNFRSGIDSASNTSNLSTSAPVSKPDGGNSQFNLFLRRSSAAFIGDFCHVKPGGLIG